MSRTTKGKEHLEILKHNFGFTGSLRELITLEKYAHRFAEDLCNKPIDDDERERREKHINKRMIELFRTLPIGFHLNLDPRGYALKIEPDMTPKELTTDWGGYGLLCPHEDF